MRDLYKAMNDIENESYFEAVMNLELNVLATDENGRMFIVNLVDLPQIYIENNVAIFNTGADFRPVNTN